MSQPADTQGVHRLRDIVVEEVSLVDRAANKHRFLVVKRSAPMTDGDDTEEHEDFDDEDADDDAPESTHGIVDATSSALGQLTKAIEVLGTISDPTAKTRLGAVSQELRALADRVAEAAGSRRKDEDAEENDGGDGDDEARGGGEQRGASAPDADLNAVIASVRSTLAQVGSMLGKAKRAPKVPKQDDEEEEDEEDEDKPSPRRAAGARPTRAPGQAQHKALTSLNEAVEKLSALVKGQQQRLARLEKGVGLPNSSAGREQVPASTEVGWPLDLNRPFDRNAVDKSISFHDL